MNNQEIKAKLRAEKIPYWRIAEKLGVHENTVLRKLRSELSEADRAAFETAIDELTAAQKETA